MDARSSWVASAVKPGSLIVSSSNHHRCRTRCSARNPKDTAATRKYTAATRKLRSCALVSATFGLLQCTFGLLQCLSGCVHCNACDSGGGYWRKRWRTGYIKRTHRAARPVAGARAARASWAARELHREHWRGLRLAEGWRLRARRGDGPARGPDARRG
eukprot:scaffold9365_cov62-Phaeocystis_antarctica.AAC.2